jgi:hypothetical protein
MLLRFLALALVAVFFATLTPSGPLVAESGKKATKVVKAKVVKVSSAKGVSASKQKTGPKRCVGACYTTPGPTTHSDNWTGKF